MLSSTSSNNVRISLPSKGRLAEESLAFLQACDLTVNKTNPRQYQATIRNLPELTVLFQRPADIVTSVRDGSVEFGITGLDVVEERRGENGQVLVLHEALNFGQCNLALAVPEGWQGVNSVEDLARYVATLGRPVRVATKFPVLTGRFLDRRSIPYTLVAAEGTLETAPDIGYADMISDLVSSGQTLRDNRLRPLSDGLVQPSQAVLIANRQALKDNPAALNIARYLLEYFEARLCANQNLAIFANMRGESPEAIAQRIFSQATIGGLQGPTISRVIVRQESESWYAVNIIVHRNQLYAAINELRSIGGSGVIVMPVNYIFDEAPPRYLNMLAELGFTSPQGNA